MTRRLQAIVLLLRSLDWFEPVPETSTGNMVRRSAKPGEAATERIRCPACWSEDLDQPLGMVRSRQFWVPCLRCGGDRETGIAGRGWIEVDAYTRRQHGSLRTGELVAHCRTVGCDACGGQRRHGNGKLCLVCRGSGVVEVDERMLSAARMRDGLRLSAEAGWGGIGDPVSAAIDKRDLIGSYWELGLALGALRLEKPRAYRLLVRLEVERSLGLERLDERQWLMRGVALHYLERLMPSEILVPAGVRIAERNRKARERIANRKESAA